MIYPRCPSCGTLIANRQIPYEKGLEEIESNPNLDEDMKLEQKRILIEALKIKLYCCKMRLMTYINKTEIIK